jgi:hypothetical protein
MADDPRRFTHVDGVMNPAPIWAHRMLDLVFGGWSILPTGGIWMRQHSVPGQVFSGGSEYGGVRHTVDFRKKADGVWTVAVAQPQPDHVPAEILPVDEWLARKAAGG